MSRLRRIALLAILLCGIASASSHADTLVFSTASTRFSGDQALSGELVAARLMGGEAANSGMRFHGFARTAQVHHVNKTASSVHMVGLEPAFGNDTVTYTDVVLGSEGARQFYDLVLFRQGSATIDVGASEVVVTSPDTSEVTETSYVDPNRPIWKEPVTGTVMSTSSTTTRVRIEGTFAISLWQWNFSVQSLGMHQHYQTGGQRTVQTTDPVTGNPVQSTSFEQVVQLQVTKGWIEITGLANAPWTQFTNNVTVMGTGAVELSGATQIQDPGAPGTIEVEGTYEVRVEPGEDTQTAHLQALLGDVLLDGQPIQLPPHLPKPPSAPGTIVQREENWTDRWTIPLLAGGLGVVSLVLYVPIQDLRFNSVRRRFDSRDYYHVLRKVNGFVERRRYSRRAAFLKAVSLLSLQQYSEAGLFLGSLSSRQSPDSATKAFLQACAAAGQGQEDVAIERLSYCLKLEPAFIEEARAMPLLSPTLTYIELGGKEGAA